MGAVLVTGATGLIGGALACHLEQHGYQVLRMSRSMGDDVTDPSAFDRFLGERVEVVYHIAGRTFVPESWTVPGPFYETNVLGTQRTLEFCRAADARMLYVSAYVYGSPMQLPVTEDHPVLPSNPYAHSKWLGEELCRFWLRAWGVPLAIARPFNVYGPMQDERYLIPSIVRQWIRDGRVAVDSFTPRRDLVYIDDLVGALAVIAQGDFDGSVYNVGSGSSSSVREVVDALGHVAGSPVPCEERGPRRPDEIPDVIAGCRLVEEGRWRAITSLEEGLERVLRSATLGSRK